MEEILDVIISRLVFALFICLIIFLYRYLHLILYPVSSKQVSKNFDFYSNPADTLHYLSRILGIAIIVSQIKFDRFFSLTLNSLNIFIISIFSIIIYLGSVWISDSVILNKFQYVDEILKKKNMTYSLICFSKNIALAFIIHQVYLNSQNSLFIYFTLWFFLNALFLIMSKSYVFFSHFPFNKMVIKDNLGVAISFFGFIMGNTILFYYAFSGAHLDVFSYLLRVCLKIFLSFLFVPFFWMMFKFLIPFRWSNRIERSLYFNQSQSISLGIYEGTVYLAGCLFTSWIVFKINLTGILSNL